MTAKREPRSGWTKRWLGAALGVMLGVGAFSGAAFAAGTAAGTLLITTVTGSYQDSKGNTKSTNEAHSEITVRQVAGVTATGESQSQFRRVGTSYAFPVLITNTGNHADTFSLAASFDNILPEGRSQTGWAIKVLKDESNTDSTVTATDELAPDAAQKVYVYVSVPADAIDGTAYTTNLKVTSQFDSTVTTWPTQTTKVTDVDLNLKITYENLTDASHTQPLPGDKVEFTYTLTNAGTGMAKNIAITDPLPNGNDVTFSQDTAFQDASGCAEGESHPYDSDSNTITFKLDQLCGKTNAAADGIVASWTYTVTVQATTAENVVDPGTELDGDSDDNDATDNDPGMKFDDTDGNTGVDGPVDNSEGVPVAGTLYDFIVTPSTTDIAAVDVLPGNNVNLSEDLNDDHAEYVIPGDGKSLNFTVTNHGNVADGYDILLGWTNTDASWTWSLKCGNPPASVGTPATRQISANNVLSLTPGASADCVAALSVPTASTNGEVDTLSTSVTNNGDSTKASTSKSAIAKLGILVTAPDVQLGITAQVIDHGTGEVRTGTAADQPAPGDKINYTVTATNNGAKPAQGTQIQIPIPNDTTYVGDSVKVDLDGTQLSNVASFDNGSPGTLTVTLGSNNIDVGKVLTIDFSVTVNSYETTSSTHGTTGS